MNKKKVQFGYEVPVVGVRWPSGKVTTVQGSKPLTLTDVRKIISVKNIRALKKMFHSGTHSEIAGVFVAPIGWADWNAGI